MATKSSGKKEMTRTKTTPRGPKCPHNHPHQNERTPTTSTTQRNITTRTGNGHRCPRRSSHRPNYNNTPSTTHTTIYTILHIAPPYANDARKMKKTLPHTEPDHRPTRTNLKAIAPKQTGRMHDELHSRSLPGTKLATPCPIEAGNGSDRQHHTEQPLAPKGDRVSKSRKRQHSSAERLPGPHPHTISHLSELLSTCRDEQFV